MLAFMQAECSVTFLLFVITHARVSLKTEIRKAPISVLLVQLYSSGIVLPMLTWATSASNQKVLGRSSGSATNVHPATCTDGQHLSIAGAQAVVVPGKAVVVRRQDSMQAQLSGYQSS